MNALAKIALASVFTAATAGLAACEKQIIAPDDKGVCWVVAQQKDGKLKFNKLASNVPNMETCAAALEGMRLRFAALGSTNNDITGAYQANFLFLRKEGVFMSRSLNSASYLALVRTGDGRLAIPGAIRRTLPPGTLPPVDGPEITPPPAK
jgi:hypothetical protein